MDAKRNRLREKTSASKGFWTGLEGSKEDWAPVIAFLVVSSGSRSELLRKQ